jgi:uncharacterized protein YecE (DUF72 family)
VTVLIGTSGFNYEHWEDGVFYPKGLPKNKQLEYYCEHFDTVELNVTFYRLPSKKAFESWRDRSPEGFRFALKGSRYITHIKRLKDAGDSVRIFYENARPLIKKTDCILWQLPPGSRLDFDRLKSFVGILKRRRGPRHAFEFRHESWLVTEVFELLGNAGMTVCRADHPVFEAGIPDEFKFEYVRRHGPHTGSPYTDGYSDAQLKDDAKLIRGWAKKRKDVFVYFNNDAMGWAPRNALQLKNLLES